MKGEKWKSFIKNEENTLAKKNKSILE